MIIDSHFHIDRPDFIFSSYRFYLLVELDKCDGAPPFTILYVRAEQRSMAINMKVAGTYVYYSYLSLFVRLS